MTYLCVFFTCILQNFVFLRMLILILMVKNEICSHVTFSSKFIIQARTFAYAYINIYIYIIHTHTHIYYTCIYIYFFFNCKSETKNSNKKFLFSFYFKWSKILFCFRKMCLKNYQIRDDVLNILDSLISQDGRR